MIYFMHKHDDAVMAHFAPVIVLAWMSTYDWKSMNNPESAFPYFRIRLRQWAEKEAKGAIIFDLENIRINAATNSYYRCFFEEESDFLLWKLNLTDDRTEEHRKLWWSYCNPKFPTNHMDKEWHEF